VITGVSSILQRLIDKNDGVPHYAVTMKRLLIPLLFCILSHATAADWPQFLGPTRNGVYAGADLADSWPADGPPVVWRKDVGQGFSGPAVVDHLLVLFHRLGDKEVVECVDSRTGSAKWKFSYPTAYVDDFGFDEGPRGTPCVAENRVYTFGAEGVLLCLDLSNGKKEWQVDTKKEFHEGKGFFGAACSPLVESNAVLLDIGGSDGAGIVAFDKNSGKVLWKCANDEAGYASPVAATIRGRRYAFFFTRAGLVAADPANGRVQFQFPWRSRENASVNAATPLVIDDMIFLSACYGTGAVLLRVRDNGVEKIWSGDDILSNHYATSVRRDDFLYGIDGRADPGFMPRPSLRCVELKTGKMRWQENSVGAATIILAGKRLLLLTEKGELISAAAAPEGYKEFARAQIMPDQVRAYPALADGFLYARGKNKLFCFNLSRKNEK
jgi:outer membrane protein assembly factor BamB